MEWHNWSGSVAARPQRIERAKTRAALAELVGAAAKVRVTGAGHSFMPLCETDGTLISMADYEGGIDVAPDRRTAWVPAGWGLDRLTAALWAQGLSLINQGDINPQSLAGATATGTHGTGAELGSLSTQACGFELMLADGSLIECGPDKEPELYQAQRLSLGLFGVVTRIRINLLPAYHLEERVERRPLAEVLERWDELIAATRHAEFWVFPYADQVIFKTLHPVDGADDRKRANDISAFEEKIFQWSCDLGGRLPGLIPGLQRTMMRLSGKPNRRVGPAWQIFPSERAIRFEEMEYEVPRAAGPDTLMAAIRHIRNHRLPVTFPFEFRVVAADDIWMSPFHAGPAASISFHQYAKMPWRDLFTEVEAVLRSSGGRPHWAKRHTMNRADVERLYPRTGDFLRVRERVDPGRKFVNADLARLFDLSPRS